MYKFLACPMGYLYLSSLSLRKLITIMSMASNNTQAYTCQQGQWKNCHYSIDTTPVQAHDS